ncbi:hypothetical protein EYF80_041833 [Liparis tanakae]|uniref:Uncharacterized protein n=1 Tax=Liparis tanakae TaxID=230148 RepID=A0A4Z2G3S9_9TELE|nr:hypothetical protein EYF80_041833 [Liparis tanakae]
MYHVLVQGRKYPLVQGVQLRKKTHSPLGLSDSLCPTLASLSGHNRTSQKGAQVQAYHSTSLAKRTALRCRCDRTRLSWIRGSPGGQMASAPLTGVITGVFSSTTQLSGRPDGLEYSDAGLGKEEGVCMLICNQLSAQHEIALPDMDNTTQEDSEQDGHTHTHTRGKSPAAAFGLLKMDAAVVNSCHVSRQAAGTRGWPRTRRIGIRTLKARKGTTRQKDTGCIRVHNSGRFALDLQHAASLSNIIKPQRWAALPKTKWLANRLRGATLRGKCLEVRDRTKYADATKFNTQQFYLRNAFRFII